MRRRRQRGYAFVSHEFHSLRTVARAETHHERVRDGQGERERGHAHAREREEGKSRERAGRDGERATGWDWGRERGRLRPSKSCDTWRQRSLADPVFGAASELLHGPVTHP